MAFCLTWGSAILDVMRRTLHTLLQAIYALSQTIRMYQGTSSSTSNALQFPSFQWEEGHPARYAIAVHLAEGVFSAKTIVGIDSCFTQAVYQQQSEKHNESRVHHMQTLHIDNVKLEDNAEWAIYQAYEDSKDALLRIFEDPSESLGMAKQLADRWIRYFPKYLRSGKGADVLAWWVVFSPILNK